MVDRRGIIWLVVGMVALDSCLGVMIDFDHRGLVFGHLHSFNIRDGFWVGLAYSSAWRL